MSVLRLVVGLPGPSSGPGSCPGQPECHWQCRRAGPVTEWTVSPGRVGASASHRDDRDCND
eukprot:2451201-Rhodomonas_salina.2